MKHHGFVLSTIVGQVLLIATRSNCVSQHMRITFIVRPLSTVNRDRPTL